MNATQNDDDRYSRLLDGFVAGDLNLPARRELFAWLDGDPWRWRRCALALSEVRELEQALHDWTAEASKPGVGARATADRPNDESDEVPSHLQATAAPPALTTFRGANRRPAHVGRKRGERVAMAASILLAFGVGVAVRGTTLDAPRPFVIADGDAAGDGVGASDDRHSTTADVFDNVAATHGQSGSQADSPGRREVPSAAKAGPSATVSSATVPSATVPSATVPGKPASTADKPATRSRDRNDENLVAANRATAGPIPAYVRSQLERRGYRVDSQHALVPVALPDGRRVMLPVDKLQLSYVGLRSY
ncbi:MAG TPA: hypothetical protein VGX76_18570 [Pirellulales bacterium]|nr:hypothetical protein [Pirellulales bacterium]